MMRHLHVFVLSFALLLPGCASWAQRYRDTPVAAFTQDVAYMNLAVEIARIATSQIGTPADLEQFDHIAGQIRTGLAVAVDGVRIGANLGSGEPNYAELLRDSKSAMGNLNAFVSGLTTPPGQAPNPMLRRAVEMTARAAQ